MSHAEIHIPKGCACTGVEMGTFTNQVELPTPAHMLALGRIGCYEMRPLICVDRCIAQAVQALWALGVVTTGCCCGHNLCDGYIGVWQSSAAPVGERDGELLALYRDFYDSVTGHFGDTHGVDAPQDGDPWWHRTNADYATRDVVAAIEQQDRVRLDEKTAADNREYEAWKAKEKADRAMCATPAGAEGGGA